MKFKLTSHPNTAEPTLKVKLDSVTFSTFSLLDDIYLYVSDASQALLLSQMGAKMCYFV